MSAKQPAISTEARRVSVVMPTLDGEQYLQVAMASCLEETYPSIELLVVDGGSQDRTIEIVGACEDPRVILIEQPANVGRLPGAINLGLERATGEYLTWTSADNYYGSGAIVIMARYLDEHPDVDWVYTDYWRVDEGGRVLTHARAEPPEQWLPQGICGPCFLFRAAVYRLLGGQDIDFPLAADFEYWLRAWKRGIRMQFLPLPLYHYRLHSTSLTSRKGFEGFLTDTERALARWVGPDRTLWPKRLARMIAANYVARAFECAGSGDDSQVPLHLCRAFRFDPRWLWHRGTLAILLRAMARRGTKHSQVPRPSDEERQ
jgi:GT2 family glycosyltransferase